MKLERIKLRQVIAFVRKQGNLKNLDVFRWRLTSLPGGGSI